MKFAPRSAAAAVAAAAALGSLLAAGVTPARADVRLPSLFSDHMVLQSGTPVPVWGWADPGEAVTVDIAGQEKATTAGPDGKWRVTLDPLAVGDPLTLAVAGKNKRAVRDVLAGEVWLASGQSNMQFTVPAGNDGPHESAIADDPQLRMIRIATAGALEPQDDVKGVWTVTAPGKIGDFSAVAYYYAKNLRKALGVPVGIVHSSYGGTPCEAWTSYEAMSTDPKWKAQADGEIAACRRLPADVAAFPAAIGKWLADNGAVDPGNTGVDKGWAKPEFDDSGWRDVTIPVTPAKLGMPGGGVLWFRRAFTFGAVDPRDGGRLNLNFLNGADATVYVNGVPLKELSTAPKSYTAQRVYAIPAALVRPGQPNGVAIRIHAFTLNGGFWQTTSRMQIPVANGRALDDHWRCAVEASFPPAPPAAVRALPKSPTAALQYMSTGLFNQMIHPLIPYRIRGAIWYQGENNANPTAARAVDYRRLLPAMIRDWRDRWGEGDFPFYVVQLANFGPNPPRPAESNWATLRESQAVVAATVPSAGLAVAVDVGVADNIHPTNKQEVGRRLSLLALNRTYGHPVPDAGPTYAGMAPDPADPAAVRVSFANATGGLVARGGPLKYFAVAGPDGKFAWADARIDGPSVVVSSPSVPHPAAVRYAWADDPEGCNLYNAAGLPAVPFRTDAPTPRP